LLIFRQLRGTIHLPSITGILGWDIIMNTALTVLERPELPAELIAPLKLAADFARASKAPATQAAYGSDFRIFDFRTTGHR
jgi:hypothetical protein